MIFIKSLKSPKTGTLSYMKALCILRLFLYKIVLKWDKDFDIYYTYDKGIFTPYNNV